MKDSCYGCTDRHVGCHSSGDCDKYKKYRKELAKKKAFLEVDKVIGDYVYHAVKRMKGVRV